MKNNYMRWIKYACLLLLFLVPAELNAKSPDFTELDKLLPEELKERNTPGAVIAIVSGDRVLYQKAFGLANVETGAAMQPEMLFRLPRERLRGGTSEILNWVALAGAMEDRKLQYFEYVTTYRSPAATGCGMGFAFWV